jgi:hypothetical protein
VEPSLALEKYTSPSLRMTLFLATSRLLAVISCRKGRRGQHKGSRCGWVMWSRHDSGEVQTGGRGVGWVSRSHLDLLAGEFAGGHAAELVHGDDAIHHLLHQLPTHRTTSHGTRVRRKVHVEA